MSEKGLSMREDREGNFSDCWCHLLLTVPISAKEFMGAFSCAIAQVTRLDCAIIIIQQAAISF